MAQKPRIPKGTRDFSPEQVAKRNYIFNTIRNSFERFGFQPIETPSFELSETLLGKYGEEGDRLIFKVLDSGEFYEKNVSNNVENSISVYVAVTYIFKDVVEYILNEIKKMEVEFLSQEEFESLLTDKGLLNFYDGKIDEWSYFLIDEVQIKETFKKILKSNPSEILEACLEFIRIKGLDFKTKIKDQNFIDWQLRWADRKLLRTITSGYIFDRINKELPNYEEINSKNISRKISEKALRYDLTVPFARYVVQHQNEIEFPFKRYQMQPVWRADRPQKGRFREFYQCDADVVGSNSLWQDVEFVQLYDDVFTALKLRGVTIKINNRKILTGIAEVIGAEDKLIDFTVALDKLDKIGAEKVKEEMLSKGIPQDGINKLQPLFDLSGSFESQINSLKTILSTSKEGLKGIEELEFINTAVNNLKFQSATLELDVTLARGLEYYTGTILEVSAPESVQMGSIGGGGRYDDLTGVFGLKNVSGVGISFGLDRIYLVLEALNLFPETVSKNTDVLFINFGEAEALFSLEAIKVLRSKGINAELYPDETKTKKQMNYANKRKIPFVVLVGDEELKSKIYTLKNMNSGEQFKVSLEALISKIK